MIYGLIYRPGSSMHYLSVEGECQPIWHGDNAPGTQALARAEAGRRMLVIDPDFDVSVFDGAEISVIAD